MRLVGADALLQQQRVGAEDDDAALGQQPLDHLRHLLVQQGLAARDRHDGRAAFLRRAEAFRDGQALVQDLVG
jgi:hypothetical protein